MKRRAVDPQTITDGARVEHIEWADGFRPQLGTVIVRRDNTREIAWDGTTAHNTLTAELAAKLVQIG